MSKNFELLQNLAREQELFRTSDRRPTLLNTVESEQPAAREVVREDLAHREPPRREVERQEVPRPKVEPERRVSGGRWQEAIKEKIRAVAEDDQKGSSQRNDLVTLRYREEVKLVQRIFPMNAQSAPQLVLFSSLEREADACAITARTAEILAGRGEGPVCVVDANFRLPLVHRYFGMESRRGLSDAICEAGPVQDFARHLASGNLWVMPSGSGGAQLGVPEFSKCVRSRMMELRTMFKYIVVNSPLFLERIPSVQSFAADGVVLIVEANSTRRETVRDVMDELQIAGAPVLGVVLNNRTFPIPDGIYHKF